MRKLIGIFMILICASCRMYTTQKSPITKNIEDFTSNKDTGEIPISFYYFNDEWIPGASIDMLCADSISKVETKEDQYGNKAVFVTIPSNLLDSLRSKVDEVYKGVWMEYGPFCEFPGGMSKFKEWLEENIRIPDGFKGKERVVVGFRVQPDGSVSDVHIIKSSKDDRLNGEALRLVKALPKFSVEYYTPQKEPIPFAIPIVFQKD